MNLFTLLFLLLLGLALGLQLWLSYRQSRHVQRHRDRVPEAFRDRITLAEHHKAADYTAAKQRLSRVELVYGAILILFWTVGGGIDWLDRQWGALDLPPQATGVGFLLSLLILVAILDLPFGAYRSFVLEARFGFNRTRPARFVADQLLALALLLAIGAPLAWAALWLMRDAGPLWWVALWLLWVGFTLLMTWAYPTLIAPLFNRFSPLQDEDLRRRVQALLRRCGFVSRGIFVMDGSRRSSHGNAYFTGLGAHKRIVFFDTLLERLEHAEVEAVLAHELGHFRLGHVPKGLLLMGLVSLAALGLLGWLAPQPWFYAGLGVTAPSSHAALALFILVAPLLGVYLHPLIAYRMRRHEYEADEFAVRESDRRALVTALVKLYRENASTLTPDPLYSAFHDSHPPAPLRVAHLLSSPPS